MKYTVKETAEKILEHITDQRPAVQATEDQQKLLNPEDENADPVTVEEVIGKEAADLNSEVYVEMCKQLAKEHDIDIRVIERAADIWWEYWFGGPMPHFQTLHSIEQLIVRDPRTIENVKP